MRTVHIETNQFGNNALINDQPRTARIIT